MFEGWWTLEVCLLILCTDPSYKCIKFKWILYLLWLLSKGLVFVFDVWNLRLKLLNLILESGYVKLANWFADRCGRRHFRLGEHIHHPATAHSSNVTKAHRNSPLNYTLLSNLVIGLKCQSLPFLIRWLIENWERARLLHARFLRYSVRSRLSTRLFLSQALRVGLWIFLAVTIRLGSRCWRPWLNYLAFILVNFAMNLKAMFSRLI